MVAFPSQAHVEPDITIEIFFVDGPLTGFGAVEVTEPASAPLGNGDLAEQLVGQTDRDGDSPGRSRVPTTRWLTAPANQPVPIV